MRPITQKVIEPTAVRCANQMFLETNFTNAALSFEHMFVTTSTHGSVIIIRPAAKVMSVPREAKTHIRDTID